MISVIMSCYNSNINFLTESINSILNQTYQDFELLVANNGVGFGLKSFLNGFEDDRIKYIDNGGNIGPTASYDHLAEIARGEYVAIQDHDDISMPNRLELEKDELDNHPELVSVSGLIGIFGGREYDDGEYMEPKRVKEELIFCQPIKQPTWMKRKWFCEQYKYDPNWMIYDYEFWSRTRDIPHFIIGEKVLKYRKSYLNTSKERKDNIRREHSLIVQRNLKGIGVDAPIELCRMLDPYNHNKEDGRFVDVFVKNRDILLKHISIELYSRKLEEIKTKVL